MRPLPRIPAAPLFGFLLVLLPPLLRGAEPPRFADLYDQAAATYEKGEWGPCAERFAAAARAAPEDRLAVRALFRAAACSARAGDRDVAFGHLGEAGARGSRDADRLQTDPDLEGLRADPRWGPVLAGVRERDAASRKGPLHAELARLYEEDQKDRAPDLGKIDWSVVGKRDEARRKRVLEIMAGGGAREAADYVHAAMVLQHGQAPEDFQKAHDWCVKAIEIDPGYPGARWLAAAAKDRYLMNLGKPQLYGTQYKRDANGPWYLWEVDPSVSDEERMKWDVPPLSRAKARVEALNAETFQPH